MALIIIGEFAENRPGDDIKLLAHNSKIIGNDELMQILVPTYLGIFSSGGNSTGEKYGTIPLENNRSAFAWACTTNKSSKSRLLVVVVPTNELNETLTKINTDEVKSRVDQIKSSISQEEINEDGLRRLMSLLDSDLQDKNAIDRLSDVFANEI